MPHKRFFQEPSKTDIAKLDCEEAKDNLVERIMRLQEGYGLCIARPLIPSRYESSWHFLRHGTRVRATGLDAVMGTIRGRGTPVDLRMRAFQKVQDTPGIYSGYEYEPREIHPYAPVDTRVRRVSLVEVLEGARIYAYVHQVPMAGIDIERYENAEAVGKDGAVYPVKVPSRTKGRRRYNFNMLSVPLRDNLQKWKIAWGTASQGHDCKRGQYMFRYSKKEDSEIFNWCAHEIAAYLEITGMHRKEKNRVPLQMSQIALPTPQAVEFYKRLCDSVLIEDAALAASDKRRVLNKAEQEILLWGLVQKKGHHATFFAQDHLKEYDWNLRHMQ